MLFRLTLRVNLNTDREKRVYNLSLGYLGVGVIGFDLNCNEMLNKYEELKTLVITRE